MAASPCRASVLRAAASATQASQATRTTAMKGGRAGALEAYQGLAGFCETAIGIAIAAPMPVPMSAVVSSGYLQKARRRSP